VTVLPRGLTARRQYAATAIGLALYLVGVVGQSPRQARERVSPYALTFGRGSRTDIDCREDPIGLTCSPVDEIDSQESGLSAAGNDAGSFGLG
jgi:hypothetical protein